MICGIVMIILVACLGYCLDRRIKQLADGVRTRREGHRQSHPPIQKPQGKEII